MQESTPKQFLMLGNKPILLHSMETFHSVFPNCNIIIVLNHNYLESWNALLRQSGSKIPHIIESGGPTRFHSVKNGLAHTRPDECIAVHDAARPLTPASLILRTFETAQSTGSAIPVIKPGESLRMLIPDGSKPVDRALFRLVQTPQAFRGDWLHQAYQLSYQNIFTDDATVVEQAGFPLTLIDGDHVNLKITTPGDLQLAACLMEGHINSSEKR